MKPSKLVYSSLAALMLCLGTWSVQAAHHEEGENKPNGLDAVLDAQTDDAKARYQYRNPKETLEFFGIKPGMKVAEALPGGGWYSKILLPYLGAEGHLLGVDYAMDMWPHFGGFANEEFMEKRKTWAETWTEGAQPWRGDSGATVSAATFGTIPEDSAGMLDAVLFIRALHNLARFEEKGGYLTNAMADAFKALKPGGIVGIVQHHGAEDRPDEWANGSNGYLKKSFVISTMEAAGFELVAESDVNSNAKDQAGEGDVVWRLPPALGGAKDDEELKAKMLAIGESNRMTLKFRKPS
ncbi:MAG: methyltransferase [Pseudomonadota bacterium]